jgi:hypothetical protein
MTLPKSGSLSFSDLMNEFSSRKPVRLSDYYRKGKYVPNTIGGMQEQRQPSSGWSFSKHKYDWMLSWEDYDGYYDDYFELYWAGREVVFLRKRFTGKSYTRGGWTYRRGTKRGGWGNKYVGGDRYAVYRSRRVDTTTKVNQSIPTSGKLSISQLYGGRSS